MAENFDSAWEQRYGVARKRTQDPGILVIPVAGPPGTPPEIVRVHAGVEFETVEFDADKLGAPPTVPHPASLDPNLTFLGGFQVATLPMVQPQGVHFWTFSGGYSYVHNRMTGLDSAMATGVAPFESGSPGNNTIPSTAFSQQIVAVGATPSAWSNPTQN